MKCIVKRIKIEGAGGAFARLRCDRSMIFCLYTLHCKV
jgi:hypothetical protein